MQSRCVDVLLVTRHHRRECRREPLVERQSWIEDITSTVSSAHRIGAPDLVLEVVHPLVKYYLRVVLIGVVVLGAEDVECRVRWRVLRRQDQAGCDVVAGRPWHVPRAPGHLEQWKFQERV